jgi:hypothetical protein
MLTIKTDMGMLASARTSGPVSGHGGDIPTLAAEIIVPANPNGEWLLPHEVEQEKTHPSDGIGHSFPQTLEGTPTPLGPVQDMIGRATLTGRTQ